MEQRYGTDPSRRYGTGVWNGCGPGACSGPPILTCPHIYIVCIYIVYICKYYIYICKYVNSEWFHTKKENKKHLHIYIISYSSCLDIRNPRSPPVLRGYKLINPSNFEPLELKPHLPSALRHHGHDKLGNPRTKTGGFMGNSMGKP
jgi:hypothetical protein